MIAFYYFVVISVELFAVVSISFFVVGEIFSSLYGLRSNVFPILAKVTNLDTKNPATVALATIIPAKAPPNVPKKVFARDEFFIQVAPIAPPIAAAQIFIL